MKEIIVTSIQYIRVCIIIIVCGTITMGDGENDYFSYNHMHII